MRSLYPILVASVVIAGYAACGHKPPPDSTKPNAGCSTSHAPAQASSSAPPPPLASASSRAPTPPPRFSGPGDCAKSASGSAPNQLKFIEESCVRAGTKLLDKHSVSLAPGQALSETFSLDNASCLRIAITADLPADISVRLLDAAGTELLGGNDATPLAFPKSGPFCVAKPGQYAVSLVAKSQVSLDWSLWTSSQAPVTK